MPTDDTDLTAPDRTAEHWAGRIRPHLARAAGAILDAGRELTAAKASLPHGEFLRCLDLAGVNARVAQQLMAVTRNPSLANASNARIPAAARTLYELSRVEPAALGRAIDDGTVTPAMTAAEARALADGDRLTADEAETLTADIHEAFDRLNEMTDHLIDGIATLNDPTDLPYETWLEIGRALGKYTELIDNVAVDLHLQGTGEDR